MDIKEVLLYLIKRELTNKELEEVISELKDTIHARNNIPF